MVSELLLRCVVNPGDFLFATLIDDPILGSRIKPQTTGHDALGFRNTEVPQSANVVAIGDSQTYGVSAGRDDSWPHQLGMLLSEPVYNMALGGYGPLQYLFLQSTKQRNCTRDYCSWASILAMTFKTPIGLPIRNRTGPAGAKSLQQIRMSWNTTDLTMPR